MYLYFLCSDMQVDGQSNIIAEAQHDGWATLGFLRGVSSLSLSGQAFCTPQWVHLMMELIKTASPLNKKHPNPKERSLLKQVTCVILSV